MALDCLLIARPVYQPVNWQCFLSIHVCPTMCLICAHQRAQVLLKSCCFFSHTYCICGWKSPPLFNALTLNLMLQFFNWPDIPKEAESMVFPPLLAVQHLGCWTDCEFNQTWIFSQSFSFTTFSSSPFPWCSFVFILHSLCRRGHGLRHKYMEGSMLPGWPCCYWSWWHWPEHCTGPAYELANPCRTSHRESENERMSEKERERKKEGGGEW